MDEGHDTSCPEPTGQQQYDVDDNDEVFTISFTGKENQRKRPPPMCNVRIEGAEVTALTDTGASVNAFDATVEVEFWSYFCRFIITIICHNYPNYWFP